MSPEAQVGQAESGAEKRAGTAFRTVLVDTSLLIEQQKREQSASRVRENLSVFGYRGASSYSKLEFKRAWVQRLAYLHSLCRQPGVRSVVDVGDKLTRNLANSYQKRHVQTCLDALWAFLDSGNQTISPAARLAQLRAHCKQAILGSTFALQQMATAFFRHTGCVRAEEQPYENPDGSLTVTIHRCSPDRIACRIHRFFEEKRSTFEALADAVRNTETASDELRSMVEHISKAVERSTHLCDDKHCRKLADAIIAVDGADMDEFAANNDKEWVIIAEIMGKPLRNPVTGVRRLPSTLTSRPP